MRDRDYERLSEALPAIKGIAILWILFYHLWGTTQGYPKPLQVLRDALGAGVKGLIEGSLGLFCLLGEHGVHFFLIASGFGLAASWWRRYGVADSAQSPFSIAKFWRRRLWRIFPLYWLAHGLVLILFAIDPKWVPFGGEIWQQGGMGIATALAASLTTLRNLILPYYFFLNSAWWYIGLAVQLYLVFPWLMQLGKRYGWSTLLGGSLVVSWLYRLIIVLLPLKGTPTDVLIRGAIFPGRLFEFVFGIVLAVACLQLRSQPTQSVDETQNPETVSAKPISSWLLASVDLVLRSRWVPLTLILWGLGIGCDWAVAEGWQLFRVPSDALIGLGEFCLAFQLIQLITLLKRGLAPLGNFSYGIYLTHSNLLVVFWALTTTAIPSYWIRFAAVAVLCLLCGCLFEFAYNWWQQRLTKPASA